MFWERSHRRDPVLATHRDCASREDLARPGMLASHGILGEDRWCRRCGGKAARATGPTQEVDSPVWAARV